MNIVKRTLLVLSIFIAVPAILFGQLSFIEVPFSPAPSSYNCSIYPVNYAKISHGDVNNDGFDDALVSGTGDNTAFSVQLYLNDGTGNLLNSGMTFPWASYADDNEIIDLNGDGYNDLVISANGIKIYLNDGSGSFLPSSAGMFNAIFNAALDFADVDGDGDQDIISQGRDINLVYLTELYLNDGLANFTPSTEIFYPLVSGSAAFFEFDNDGDSDLFLIGSNSSGQRFMKCYLNDGLGSFSEVSITNGNGAILTTANVVDLNNDGLEEVLVTGQAITFFETCVVKNDGMGNCIRESFNLPAINEGGMDIADVDNDSDVDILLTGKWGTNSYAELFKNDGTGSFVRSVNTPFKTIFRGDVEFSDIDNDGDQDVILVGSVVYGTEYANVYLNDGFGNFTGVSSQAFGMVGGLIMSGDIDSDGDKDVLLCGYTNDEARMSKLFLNDGLGNFSIDPTEELDSFSGDEMLLSDLDQDGDPDIILCGNNGVENKTQLYENDGSGSFSPVPNMLFENFLIERIYNEDIDNDGDEDLLMFNNYSSTIVKKLYRNNGAFNFQEVTGDPILDVDFARVSFGDIDDDGDSDAFASGWINNILAAKIYVNNGSGAFTESLNNSIYAFNSPESDFTDYDGDGDLDLYYAGTQSSGFYGKFYQNDGLGSFQQVVYQPFEEFELGRLDFHDLDLDGDEEALVSGENSADNAYCTLYDNWGTLNYVDVIGDSFPDVIWSDHEIEDFNGDGKPDILITGLNGSDRVAKLFLNSTNVEIQENSLGNEFQISPNPVNEFLNVISNFELVGKNYQIVDISGKTINNGRFEENTLNLDVHLLCSGWYLFRIEGTETPVKFFKK